jgi:predicted AlkP superfamily pyrophosphatase or phosphodiesterase
VFANGVIGVLPSLTFPAHTTIITGAAGGCGIYNNRILDPENRYTAPGIESRDIKAPTLTGSCVRMGSPPRR